MDYLKIILLICLGILCAQVEPATSDFPILLNAQVKKEVKRLTGTPGGKKHVKECRRRMKKHEKLITKKLTKHNLPRELLAIPFVESCYQNIHSKKQWGSGIWMLIKPTARSLGLKVNKKTDERLNVEKSTEAAFTYIKKNHKILRNWHHTIIAYNIGENKVLYAIKKSAPLDQSYLVKVMAVAIILKSDKSTLAP